MTESSHTHISPDTEVPAGEPGTSLHRAKRRIFIVLLVLAAVLLVLVIPLPNAWRSTWRCKVLDLGHIPLFALVTFVFHRMLRFGLWSACCVAATIAGACEVLQGMVHRSADLFDFIRGVIGSLLVVLVLTGLRRPRKFARVSLHAALVMMLLAWPFADAFPKLWDAWNSYRAFPILCDFQTRWEPHRWLKDNATVERVTGDEWQGRWVGRLEFFPNDRHSSAVVLFPVLHDWSHYHQLCCEFLLPQGPTDVLISVRDGRRVTGSRKRFDMEREYAAGEHSVRIDLQSLARGDEFAPLDLTRVQSFHLVLPQLGDSRTMYLRSVRLE